MLPPKEKTFVEIVKEMLEKGTSFNDAVSSLVLMGLNKKDAGKLVDLLQEGSEGKYTESLNYLVRKKIIAMKEAGKIEEARRIRVKKNKQLHSIKSARKKAASIMGKYSAAQRDKFEGLVIELISAIEGQYTAKRKIRALLTEFKARNIRTFDKRELDKAIKEFGP